MFVIGGYDCDWTIHGPTYHSELWSLNLDSDTFQWTQLTAMDYRRCYVGTCQWRGKIVAIGGHDGHERHRSVEEYDPATNMWRELAGLNQARSDAAVVNFNDRIFVIGGFDGAVSSTAKINLLAETREENGRM